jgi:hypothetical protein
MQRSRRRKKPDTFVRKSSSPGSRLRRRHITRPSGRLASENSGHALDRAANFVPSIRRAMSL